MPGIYISILTKFTHLLIQKFIEQLPYVRYCLCVHNIEMSKKQFCPLDCYSSAREMKIK